MQRPPPFPRLRTPVGVHFRDSGVRFRTTHRGDPSNSTSARTHGRPTDVRFQARGAPLLAFLGLAVVLGAAAPSFDLSYRVWTAEDGLPQSSVYGIDQTRDGYIWIATLD